MFYYNPTEAPQQLGYYTLREEREHGRGKQIYPRMTTHVFLSKHHLSVINQLLLGKLADLNLFTLEKGILSSN